MNRTLKRSLQIVGALAGVAVLSVGGYVLVQTRAFDASVDKVYDVPVPPITASNDPTVIARGKHLVESVGACATRDCHGGDLGGGKTISMGPVATLTGPNVTAAGYTDGELARLVQHGIKKDGRTVRFMPVQDFAWLPASDVLAIVSYVKTVAPVDRANGPMKIGVIGKVLDRQGKLALDIARRIDHANVGQAEAPAPTTSYGKFLASQCQGCHGEGFSGGRIPGAPSSLPIPLNITPDDSGLKTWSYDDFARLLDTGIRKNGQKLDPFMPVDAYAKFDDTERHALWAFLQSVPPRPFGNR